MPDDNWKLSGNTATNPPTSFLGTTDNHPLVVKTNGTEAMRVDPTGNVGVGSTSPTFRFEVRAPNQLGLSVSGPRAGVGGGIQIRAENGTAWELLATGADRKSVV